MTVLATDSLGIDFGGVRAVDNVSFSVNAGEIFAIIGTLRDAETALLLVEQNAAAALAIADRGYVLETGRVVLEDTGAALLADPSVRAAYLGI